MATTADHKELELDDAIAVAMEGLEVASISGSTRAVHSELYELTLATRRRQGTVFPLEAVRPHEPDPGSNDYLPRPSQKAPQVEPGHTEPTQAETATNGIAPKAEVVAQLEEAEAESTRLREEE